ncbi:BON domain-containing protein [Pseudanabaena sp. FACHB-2040]|uniref:BON domain-containing protein n=1 Tax=Pseudanabaena sp. FACHB-2040 TaxID=2692859 RepID=UPI0016824495|nr:BON domain-containing protein [Pseudanabaena sp. FACHB-2040]MBD2256351.1 BON domain-containing protein [Pseudanabaena sp. FACHB-2040]
MGWLKRIFGQGVLPNNQNKGNQGTQARSNQGVQQNTQAAAQAAPNATVSQQQSIPPERVGLNGEYDQSGLAKRVAQAFDEDPNLDDIETVWVAQTGSTVVLKGKVPQQQLLDKMVSVARQVRGATSVDINQVQIG